MAKKPRNRPGGFYAANDEHRAANRQVVVVVVDCGATDNLTKTECCGQWICDDEDQYVLFSYAHNSCTSEPQSVHPLWQSFYGGA